MGSFSYNNTSLLMFIFIYTYTYCIYVVFEFICFNKLMHVCEYMLISAYDLIHMHIGLQGNSRRNEKKEKTSCC